MSKIDCSNCKYYDFNACSIWVCDKCGKNFLSDDLSQNCELVNFTLKGSLITVEKRKGGCKNDR